MKRAKFMFNIFQRYPKLFSAFSEKKDGSMKILKNRSAMKNNTENRRKFLGNKDIDQENLISAEIIHGSRISIVSSKDRGKVIHDADGLVTRENDSYISITTADCLPIFLFEPRKEIIGMIHAGWRSLDKNILVNAIEKIKELDGLPENILAGIGPAICQKHYRVGSEVAEKLEKYPRAIKKDTDKLFLDIKKIAQLQLLELGLKKENIEISPECTFELPEKYFSARRDKLKEVEAMMAVIGIKE